MLLGIVVFALSVVVEEVEEWMWVSKICEAEEAEVKL